VAIDAGQDQSLALIRSDGPPPSPPPLPPPPSPIPPSLSTATTSLPLAFGLSFGLLLLVLLTLAIALFIRAKLVRRHSIVPGIQDKRERVINDRATVHIYHFANMSRAEYLSADISQLADRVQINSCRCLRIAQRAHKLALCVKQMEDNAAKHSSVMKACELDDLAAPFKHTLIRCRTCVAFWSEMPLDDSEVRCTLRFEIHQPHVSHSLSCICRLW
jgi:hypothetical protein